MLIGARRGSPLVFGIGDEGEYCLASDVAAIVNHTHKVVYLDDNDVVEYTGAKYIMKPE